MLSWLDVIDIRTVGFMIIMTCVISSMVSIVLWRLNRPMAGLVSWMMAAFAGTAAFLAWVSMPWLGRAVAIPLNMAIATGSLMLILDGTLRFRSLIPPGRLRWMTPVAVMVAAVQVRANLDQDWLRIVLNDVLNSLILAAMIAALLHHARRDERIIHLMIAVATVLMIVVYLIRVDVALATPRGQFRAPGDPAHAYVFFVSLIFILSWTFGMLLMVNLKVQRALADMADRDPLTGIGNRRMLDRLAGRHLPRSGTALILIDLDGFKRVNDDHGHDQGDQALCWIADMLKASMRPGETVIRMGGDEFALFVEEAGDATALGQRVHRLAARINIALARDRHLMPLPRRISTGYAIVPDDGQTLTDLCAAADRRMYDDKHAARPAGPCGGQR